MCLWALRSPSAAATDFVAPPFRAASSPAGLKPGATRYCVWAERGETRESMYASGRRGILLSKFPDAAVHCDRRAPCQGRRAPTDAKLGLCPCDPVREAQDALCSSGYLKAAESGARPAHCAHFFAGLRSQIGTPGRIRTAGLWFRRRGENSYSGGAR